MRTGRQRDRGGPRISKQERPRLTKPLERATETDVTSAPPCAAPPQDGHTQPETCPPPHRTAPHCQSHPRRPAVRPAVRRARWPAGARGLVRNLFFSFWRPKYLKGSKEGGKEGARRRRGGEYDRSGILRPDEAVRDMSSAPLLSRSLEGLARRSERLTDSLIGRVRYT